MGMPLSLLACDFEIKKEHIEPAAQRIRDFLRGEKGMIQGADGGYYAPADLTWALDIMDNQETLQSMMETHFFYLAIDEETGNVTEVYVEDCNDHSDDLILFALVAPFVKADSYLEFDNGYGDHWRLVFNGEECKYIEPVITWPDPFQSEVKEDDDYYYPNAHTL